MKTKHPNDVKPIKAEKNTAKIRHPNDVSTIIPRKSVKINAHD